MQTTETESTPTRPAPPKRVGVRVRRLLAVFDMPLERRHIPAFRGALINKVGQEHVRFHNHDGDGFRYGYPLLQYKVIGRNAAVLCLNDGAEEMLAYFQKPSWDLNLRGERVEVELKHIGFDYLDCGLTVEPLRYRIFNWFALNEHNFERYRAIDDGGGRVRFLGRILVGNILSFAKGIDWNVDGRVEVKVLKGPNSRVVGFKDHQILGFDLEFEANVALPPCIGLGKSVARGFGTIRRIG